MDRNWKNWCRLCSTENGEHVDLFVKAEHQFKLVPIIEKHLMLTISQYEEAPTSICVDCLNFVLKLSQFAIRSAKVENMFSELILRKTDYQENDPASVRKIFEIDSLDDFVEIKAQHFPSAIKTETAEVGTNVPEIKDELITESDPFRNETSNPSTKRKRGRPRKSDNEEPLQQLTPVEHRVIEDDELPLELQMYTPEDDSMEEDKTSEKPEIHKKRKSLSKSGQKMLKSQQMKTEDQSKAAFKCSICSKSFSTKWRLTRHEDSHLPDDEKKCINIEHNSKTPSQCSICSKSFSTKWKLTRHEETHRPSVVRKLHPCPYEYCDKKFTQFSYVRTHVKIIHTVEKSFICEECGKAFPTNGALTEHKVVHMEEGLYQCSMCPKKCKNMARLKKHQSIHNTEKEYECSECGIKCNTRQTLRAHMVVHSNEKRYKCHFCSNEYKRSKTLKNHLISHTGLRPYICPFCDKTFANGSNCRTHKKKDHPVELAAMEAAGIVSAPAKIPRLEHLQPSNISF